MKVEFRGDFKGLKRRAGMYLSGYRGFLISNRYTHMPFYLFFSPQWTSSVSPA